MSSELELAFALSILVGVGENPARISVSSAIESIAPLDSEDWIEGKVLPDDPCLKRLGPGVLADTVRPRGMRRP